MQAGATGRSSKGSKKKANKHQNRLAGVPMALHRLRCWAMAANDAHATNSWRDCGWLHRVPKNAAGSSRQAAATASAARRPKSTASMSREIQGAHATAAPQLAEINSETLSSVWLPCAAPTVTNRQCQQIPLQSPRCQSHCVWKLTNLRLLTNLWLHCYHTGRA